MSSFNGQFQTIHILLFLCLPVEFTEEARLFSQVIKYSLYHPTMSFLAGQHHRGILHVHVHMHVHACVNNRESLEISAYVKSDCIYITIDLCNMTCITTGIVCAHTLALFLQSTFLCSSRHPAVRSSLRIVLTTRCCPFSHATIIGVTQVVGTLENKRRDTYTNETIPTNCSRCGSE